MQKIEPSDQGWSASKWSFSGLVLQFGACAKSGIWPRDDCGCWYVGFRVSHYLGGPLIKEKTTSRDEKNDRKTASD